ncbi:hypothetical protein IWW52_001734 [Coemansia sp. RSA 2704]|nr:hypothetical protein IWW52_001734 [Coemansia sp. RSA 2704]
MDETAEYDRGSSGEEEIFVAEAGYAQLSDSDDNGLDNDALPPDGPGQRLDDAFECHEFGPAARNPAHIAAELARAIDERLFSELEEKHDESLDQESLDKSIDSPAELPERAASTGPIEVDIARSSSRMPAEHISQIKSVMAGIRLNDSAIPEWAKRVPESAWMPKRKDPDPSTPS